jgi:UDP-2,3-diacylglucosamine pyrophosphatase LpxH
VDVGHIIVISDLHISSGLLDDFDRELEDHFARFLENDLACRPYAVELVINGDFLDFVQAPPYKGPTLQAQSQEKLPLCFTQDQSCQKLAAIRAAHQPTFDALQRFLAAKPDNSLTVLPGNHDPDFFWPAVRDNFSKLVSGGDASRAQRIHVHQERAYRPRSCPEAWIEHGQQYDPINSFFISEYPFWSEKNPPILRDQEQQRLYACQGTRFMIDYLNDLDAAYPFVDNVKPFSRFVKLFLVSAADPRFGPLKAAVAAWGILEYLAKLSLIHPKDILGITPIRESGKSELLARLRKLAKENGEMFRRLNQAYPGDRNLGVLLNDASEREHILLWLSVHTELLEEPLPALNAGQLSTGEGEDGYLSLTKGFRLDEKALLREGAINLLDAQNEKGVKLVVMGHTHEPDEKPGGINYYNTGSWTRYYRFNDGKDHASAWSILRDQSYVSFPYMLNYVDIDTQHPGAAQMFCFEKRNHD